MSAHRTDPAAIADHLRALYGAGAPGYLSIFTLPSRTTAFVAGDALVGESVDNLATVAAAENVYTGVGLLLAPLSDGRRGRASDVLAVPGLWFDLDIAGSNHKADALPGSRLEACDFLASLPLEPSRVVATGGGLHVYWLFRELLVFAGDAERSACADLSARFQRAIIGRGVERGWTLDNTSDLARILRPAGTFNHKTHPPTPVVTMWRSDVRYTASDFAPFAAAAATTSDAPSVSRAKATGDRQASAAGETGVKACA